MDAPQWSMLRQCLLDRGWTPRNDSLYAPHETLWFIDADQADLVSFRASIGLAAASDSAHAAPVDHDNVHQDLLSLVQALDAALES
jgi:hypothetical protein